MGRKKKIVKKAVKKVAKEVEPVIPPGSIIKSVRRDDIEVQDALVK